MAVVGGLRRGWPRRGRGRRRAAAASAACCLAFPRRCSTLWIAGAEAGAGSRRRCCRRLQFVLGNTARPGHAAATCGCTCAASLQPRAGVGFAAVHFARTWLLGSAMGLSRGCEAYVLPSFNALVQIPVLGWLPFVLLLVGIGEPLKYILIAKAALVHGGPQHAAGFARRRPRCARSASAYGYTPRQQVLEIVLPHAVPTLFTGLRLGFTKAWLSLVVVVLVASSEGLGYLIVYGRQLFQLDLVMAAVIVVGAIGYAIDRVLDWAGAAWEPPMSAASSGARRTRRCEPLRTQRGSRWRGLVLPLAAIALWWLVSAPGAGELGPAGVACQGAGHRTSNEFRPAACGAPWAPTWHAARADQHRGGLLLGAFLGLSPLFNRLVGPKLQHLQANLAVRVDPADLGVVRAGRRGQGGVPVAGGAGAGGGQHLRRHPQRAAPACWKWRGCTASPRWQTICAGGAAGCPAVDLHRASTWR